MSQIKPLNRTPKIGGQSKMATQIIERAYEVADHAAQHSDFESYSTSASRLRTLDRQGEISTRQYDRMDAIAHARAGNTRQAQEAIARLGGPQHSDSQDIKRLLLGVPEASIDAYRNFVEQLIPAHSDQSSFTIRNTRRFWTAVSAACVLLLLGSAFVFYMRNESATTSLENSKSPNVVIPLSGAPPLSGKVRASEPATEYERMNGLVCKVTHPQSGEHHIQLTWPCTALGSRA